MYEANRFVLSVEKRMVRGMGAVKKGEQGFVLSSRFGRPSICEITYPGSIGAQIALGTVIIILGNDLYTWLDSRDRAYLST